MTSVISWTCKIPEYIPSTQGKITIPYITSDNIGFNASLEQYAFQSFLKELRPINEYLQSHPVKLHLLRQEKYNLFVRVEEEIKIRNQLKEVEERIKQTGEVFTPLELVDEILEQLPQELFEDPTKTFLDPSCGDGNFLVRVIAFKIQSGSSIEQALETTYGVDLMPDNVQHCKDRLLELADNYDTASHGIKKVFTPLLPNSLAYVLI